MLSHFQRFMLARAGILESFFGDDKKPNKNIRWHVRLKKEFIYCAKPTNKQSISKIKNEYGLNQLTSCRHLRIIPPQDRLVQLVFTQSTAAGFISCEGV